MRVIATLEIRDGDKLNEVNALALARMIATRRGSGIIKRGLARVELRISRAVRSHRQLVTEWLESQGVKLIADRSEYAGRYKATLYQ